LKKYLLLLILVSILVPITPGQNYSLPLWEKNIPNQNDNKVEEEIQITDKLRITAVDKPTIDVYLPSKGYATGGEAVVICPGGGYKILAYNFEGTDVAKWLNINGIAGIVLKYRLPFTPNNIEGRLSPFFRCAKSNKINKISCERMGN
jgi:acetyl esterase/lipase